MKILVSLSEQQKFWAKNLLLRDAKLLTQTEKGLVGTGLDHNDPNEGKEEVHCSHIQSIRNNAHCDTTVCNDTMYDIMEQAQGDDKN